MAKLTSREAAQIARENRELALDHAMTIVVETVNTSTQWTAEGIVQTAQTFEEYLDGRTGSETP